MKKITLMIACVGFISLTSCKKERTCTCITTTTSSNGTITTDQPDNTTYKKVKKGYAKDKCMSYTAENTSTYTNGNVSVSATTKSETKCDLK